MTKHSNCCSKNTYSTEIVLGIDFDEKSKLNCPLLMDWIKAPIIKVKNETYIKLKSISNILLQT